MKTERMISKSNLRAYLRKRYSQYTISTVINYPIYIIDGEICETKYFCRLYEGKSFVTSEDGERAQNLFNIYKEGIISTNKFRPRPYLPQTYSGLKKHLDNYGITETDRRPVFGTPKDVLFSNDIVNDNDQECYWMLYEFPKTVFTKEQLSHSIYTYIDNSLYMIVTIDKGHHNHLSRSRDGDFR